jgi:hypothetical protein
MAVLLDKNTRLIVQGLTGREGRSTPRLRRPMAPRSWAGSPQARAGRPTRAGRSSTACTTRCAKPARTRRSSSCRPRRRPTP